MRDRLIELIKHIVISYFAEQIADHLLANGVIVPPYKIGQLVYVLRSQTSNGENLYLKEERIDHYRIFDKTVVMCFESGRVSVSDHLWGKTVFLTREEAERALNGGVEVKCKDCEYLMFSDCYGECSKAYKGIVSPDDSCGKGKLKGGVKE